MRDLTIQDVTIELIAETDDMPVRGNALASGNDIEDKACEDEIIEKINNGDVWAWASVEVKATYKTLTASTYLGGCSYKDEAEFKAGGYYDDMVVEVLEDLNTQLKDLFKDFCLNW